VSPRGREELLSGWQPCDSPSGDPKRLERKWRLVCSSFISEVCVTQVGSALVIGRRLSGTGT
jgi:hypothetical protein